jgi:hypothetical protein
MTLPGKEPRPPRATTRLNYGTAHHVREETCYTSIHMHNFHVEDETYTRFAQLVNRVSRETTTDQKFDKFYIKIQT